MHVRTPKLFIVLSFVWLSTPVVHTQGGSSAADTTPQIKVVVSASDASSESTITVPPDTSWTGSISFRAGSPAAVQGPGNLDAWLNKESALNGLQTVDLRPWHIVIAYDEFDKDGDNVHSGVVEELWAGPKKYKISYKSDDLTQTDFATAQGLFRFGDQRWPNRAEIQVRNEIVDPFFYARTLQGLHASNVERKFGAHTLDCVLLERAGGIAIPTQYCFEPNGSALRYSRGSGWYQTAYNDIVSFQGSNLAREVTVTDGGKPYLNLHIQNIETVSIVDEKDFAPPADSVSLQGKRITGVLPTPVLQSPPEWPTSLRYEHFSVTVEIVVGKDGRVVSAHAISGLSDAFKAAEKTAKKWTFKPYLVLDEPAELESKIVLSNN